ncbi:hypothetical protein KB553_18660 [Chryseobacterium rhizoplanae]|uniref:hypothetical protein n=1 Tax=Chryseobacterium rhizoplanae TaxID=1609531 RepID=UPI001CE27BE2|nr:hypothetical protein [Chryseobacterium rhizoplanae]UCA59036.1 hypothetical protein KB553_18660 [Chryseobacterium rhizoplanae]
MNFPVYPTFDLFFESYLEEFIKYNKYEYISLEEYNYHLAFKYAKIFRDLPFEEGQLEEEKGYIEREFGFFHIIYLLNEYEFKERTITLQNTKKISKILRKEAFRIASYLKNEILKNEVSSTEKKGGEISDLDKVFQYSKEVRDYARSFFGDLSKIELLKYLSKNLISTSQKFTELTKYNQIFAYFHDVHSQTEEYKSKSERIPYVEKQAYKNLIKELFGFEYGRSEIKGSTPKHLEQLKKLAIEFQNIKK